MSTKTSHPRVYVEPHGSGWRLNYSLKDADNKSERKRHTLPTEAQAEFAADLIDGVLAVRRDRDPWPMVLPHVADYAGSLSTEPETKAAPVPTSLKRSLSVAEWYDLWLPKRKPFCRPANFKDYQHNASHFLPHLGDIKLAKLSVHDLVRCRAALLSAGKRGKPLSKKTVRNIMLGTLKRMLRDARAEEVMADNPFEHPLFKEWPETNNPADEVPQADPFNVEEKFKVIEAVRRRYWGNPKLKGLYAYVFTLLNIPFRPSEASGLNWGDIDLANARAHVRRSYNSGALGKPKTQSSRRTVMLPPEVVEVLSQIQPLHVSPDDPVFVNRDGLRIDRKHFSPTWNGCLRAAGVRLRGIYACKDTCITLGRLAGASWAYLETQSGVREATLIKHYFTLLPNEVPDEFEKIRSWERDRLAASQPQPHQPQTLGSRKAS